MVLNYYLQKFNVSITNLMKVHIMSIKNSFIIQGNDIEHDAIDDYFECITACSIDNEGMHCITKCVEAHLKND